MLTELRIRDFAIIDDLQLTLEPGFSVLTGETGAGKSIIVDAVDLVLGGRSDSAVVRAGAERTIVEATFLLNPVQWAVTGAILEREDLMGDAENVLLLGREVRLNGRSVSRINGRAVTLSLLREVAEGLVDIHGQSEHLSLLRVREHLEMLDRYTELHQLRTQVAEMVGCIRVTRRELEDLRRSERELAHRADLLQFQISEIEAASLQPDEDKELLEERLRLTNAEQLAEMLGEALRALGEGDGDSLAALDMMGRALRALERLSRIDPSLEPQLRSAENVNYQTEELVTSLRDYEERVEHNPRRLQEVEERLVLVRGLQRKYGSTIPDILAYAEEAARELDAIIHSEERISELEEEEERLLAELGSLAVDLSEQRREAAQRLAVGIEEELRDLRMDGARFGVEFEWREDAKGVPLPQDIAGLKVQALSSGVEQLDSRDPDLEASPKVTFDTSGIDRIEFLVSPNPGEPLKPLAKIASGGETSRLMLALKTVLSRADETPTLVFDEIDQGIGGRVGMTVGQKLWGLSAGIGTGDLHHQVLCVTHLPQLAAFGDVHLKVQKHVDQIESEERTVTRVKSLENRERVAELALMLGGSGEAIHRSAEEILEDVTGHKEQASLTTVKE